MLVKAWQDYSAWVWMVYLEKGLHWQAGRSLDIKRARRYMKMVKHRCHCFALCIWRRLDAVSILKARELVRVLCRVSGLILQMCWERETCPKKWIKQVLVWLGRLLVRVRIMKHGLVTLIGLKNEKGMIFLPLTSQLLLWSGSILNTLFDLLFWFDAYSILNNKVY